MRSAFHVQGKPAVIHSQRAGNRRFRLPANQRTLLMPHQTIVTEAIAKYKQTFNEAIEAAQTLFLEPIFTLEFNTAQIEQRWIQESLMNLRTGHKTADKRKCAIYVFSLADSNRNHAIAEALLDQKRSRQRDEKKDNLCTVNGAFSGSSTLYVGRSFTPKSRITQHLGKSENGTYAMHLQQWACPLALPMRLDVYDVPAYQESARFERAMNVLETGLWDYLQPLLGRRGDK